MPLTGSESVLAGALQPVILSELQKTFAPDPTSPSGVLWQTAFSTALATAIANVIVPHIVANSLVVGTCPTGGGPLAGGLVT